MRLLWIPRFLLFKVQKQKISACPHFRYWKILSLSRFHGLKLRPLSIKEGYIPLYNLHLLNKGEPSIEKATIQGSLSQVPCPRFPVPGSLSQVPCPRFPVPGSLSQVPCPRFPVPGSNIWRASCILEILSIYTFTSQTIIYRVLFWPYKQKHFPKTIWRVKHKILEDKPPA